MDDKKLIKQLNSLKKISPALEWKKSERDILMSQISASSPSPSSFLIQNKSNKRDIINLLKLPRQMFAKISQPVLAVVLILIFFFGGGILSLWAARGTKPGDSLYVAKKIGERAQLTFAFGNKDKARLGIEFASQRAKELNQVLSESNNKLKEKKVKKLVDDLNNEIDGVKLRLAKISHISNKINKPKARVAIISSSTPAQKSVVAKEEGDTVFSASANKKEKGVEISKPIVPKFTQSTTTSKTESSTSTPKTVANTSLKNTPFPNTNPQTALKEAADLFSKEDYSGTLNKLDEAVQAIGKADDSGEVKGTSTRSKKIKIDNSGKVLGVEDASSSSVKINNISGQASSSKEGK